MCELCAHTIAVVSAPRASSQNDGFVEFVTRADQICSVYAALLVNSVSPGAKHGSDWSGCTRVRGDRVTGCRRDEKLQYGAPLQTRGQCGCRWIAAHKPTRR